MGTGNMIRVQDFRIIILPGPAVSIIYLRLNGRIQPGISELGVQGAAPAFFLVRVRVKGRAHLPGKRAQEVLNKACHARREILVSKVKGVVHNGVRIHIGGQPGMQFHGMRQFMEAPGGR